MKKNKGKTKVKRKEIPSRSKTEPRGDDAYFAFFSSSAVTGLNIKLIISSRGTRYLLPCFLM